MKRCKERCCLIPSYQLRQFQLLLVAALFASGIVLFIAGAVTYAEPIVFVSLVPFTISIAPIFICGPPPPFHTPTSGISLTFDTVDTIRYNDIGNFLTGFLVTAGVSIILVLTHAGRIGLATAGFTLMGEVFVLATVLLYLIFFHMPRTEEEQEEAETNLDQQDF